LSSETSGCCLMFAAAIGAIRFSSESKSHRRLQRWLDGTGRDRPMAWAPRSPDITSMDFFLRDHIKALIYTSPFCFSGFASFPTLVKANLTVRCKDASPTYISFTINIYFGLPYHFTKFGHGVFPHLYIKIQPVPRGKQS